jgi:hypothetical protein
MGMQISVLLIVLAGALWPIFALYALLFLRKKEDTDDE